VVTRSTKNTIFVGISWGIVACASPPPPPPNPAPAPTEAPTLSKVEVPPAPPPKPEPVVSQPKLAAPWLWVLSNDHGVRDDVAGQGGFLTPRYHGSHNGLDMLAPIGAKVQAPCSGKAQAGASESFGIWVHLVCRLPKELRTNTEQRASLFFSHLRRAAWKGDEVREVARGDILGGVGKTGNAAGSNVASHLHFEIIFHDDEEAALAETHSGKSQSDTTAAHSVRALIESRCLAPNAFARRDGDGWRNRRADPFLVLSCFTDRKPGYEKPKGTLAEASTPWSRYYSATGFDVDVGRQAVAAPALARTE
jgi:murein DD-endopeptidase MepM/ murein hydrolase activator NlpD